MTREEFDNIKLPSLVRVVQQNLWRYIPKSKDLSDGKLIVVEKRKDCLGCFRNSVFNDTDGTWWHYMNVEIIEQNYYNQREQMNELEKSL